MHKILLESDSLTVDLNAVYSANNADSDHKINNANSELEEVLKRNGIEDADIINKILAFGKPFENAVKILGDKSTPGSGSNPILAFVKHPTVQDQLIKPGLLRADTFKAIYNAVAKKLVADSEFYAETESYYNIIYCKDLYRMSAKDIEEYLVLQSKILSPTATQYTKNDIIKNKKVFIFIGDIAESDNEKRIEAIKSYTKSLPTMLEAKLNSLDVAEDIAEALNNTNTTSIDSNSQNNVLTKLLDNDGKISLAKAMATILSLSTNASSKKAAEALNTPSFANVDAKQLVSAVVEISTNNILPKGQIRTEDADVLVDKIMAKVAATS